MANASAVSGSWVSRQGVTMSNPPATELPAIDPAVVRRVTPAEDLVSVFCDQAESVGLHATRSTETALAQDVAALLHDLASGSGAQRLKVIVEPTLFCRQQVEQAMGNDVERLDPRVGDDTMFAADVGVTGVYAAVAETGSLVCASGPECWRGLSLIPPAHIAIVRAQQIVPDLIDLFAAGLPADLPTNLTLISGPSKTADIEGILITGVHGPGTVHVIVVSDAAARKEAPGPADPSAGAK